MKSRITVYIALAATFVLVAFAARQWLSHTPETPMVGSSGGFQVSATTRGPTIGGPFTMVDHDGRQVTEADWHGRFMLVFFGYTFCPDVCPTGLSTAAEALDELGEEGRDIIPIFVSVDPERDTPERLKEYVAHFHPRMVGLTGSQEQINDMARKFRVYFAKSKETGDDPENYLIDHSAITYLMGRDGKFVAHFGHGTTAAHMVERLQRILEADGK